MKIFSRKFILTTCIAFLAVTAVTSVVMAQGAQTTTNVFVQKTETKTSPGITKEVRFENGQTTSSVTLPKLPGAFESSTSEARIRELEKKYADKETPVRDLLKKQQEELKTKREQVKNIWKLCDEKIRAYKNTRLKEVQTLRQSIKTSCAYQPIDTTLTGTERATARIAENERLVQCRKNVQTQIQTFEKETRLQIIAIQKTCQSEIIKPAPTTTPSAKIQGIQVDEVPVYNLWSL